MSAHRRRLVPGGESGQNDGLHEHSDSNHVDAIRLITLDLDDTLWPCQPVIQAAKEALHAWLRERAPRLTDAHDIASMRLHRQGIMKREPEIAHDLGRVRHHALVELLERFDYDRALADQALALFIEHRCRVEPYADVLPALRVLSTRYRLVSLTNGNSNIEVTPLNGLFKHSLSAADVGAAKPDPAMFAQALALTDCQPNECLHLGDDPWMDVDAARRAGLHAAWINRTDRDWPQALQRPTLTIKTLDALVDWLEGIEHGL
ncbi:HAD family hydrolase [Thiocystis violacea]|uniref:HAD family hydrolase n=1 Tax=Thiocystis violacea TaxID=13725 RepID=UPI001907CAC3|nr:HAD family hydrolase [Thiocystis violacea]MBK1720808.1 haloacid dehalogenase [Thiocystis violacea]